MGGDPLPGCIKAIPAVRDRIKIQRGERGGVCLILSDVQAHGGGKDIDAPDAQLVTADLYVPADLKVPGSRHKGKVRLQGEFDLSDIDGRIVFGSIGSRLIQILQLQAEYDRGGNAAIAHIQGEAPQLAVPGIRVIYTAAKQTGLLKGKTEIGLRGQVWVFSAFHPAENRQVFFVQDQVIHGDLNVIVALGQADRLDIFVAYSVLQRTGKGQGFDQFPESRDLRGSVGYV